MVEKHRTLKKSFFTYVNLEYYYLVLTFLFEVGLPKCETIICTNYTAKNVYVYDHFNFTLSFLNGASIKQQCHVR